MVDNIEVKYSMCSLKVNTVRVSINGCVILDPEVTRNKFI